MGGKLQCTSMWFSGYEKIVLYNSSVFSLNFEFLQDINDAMYLNTIYSGFSGLVGYVFAGFLIKSFGTRNVIGKRFVRSEFISNSIYLFPFRAVCGLWIVGCCGIGMFWATNTLVTVVLSSIYVSLGSICTTAFLGVVVNLFPTSLR